MPDNFDWLIRARALNQEVLLRLYRISEVQNRGEWTDTSRDCFALLVGAAFSLWRAAFLTDAQRDSSKITEDAIKLLKRLIADNAVAYPQDRDTREWMGGYYINNAIWRVRLAWQSMAKDGNGDAMPEVLRKLKHFDERGALQEKPVDLWNLSHEALIALIEALEKRT